MDENGGTLEDGKDEWLVCRVSCRGMRTEEGRDERVGVEGIGHGGTDARLFASDSSGLFGRIAFVCRVG